MKGYLLIGQEVLLFGEAYIVLDVQPQTYSYGLKDFEVTLWKRSNRTPHKWPLFYLKDYTNKGYFIGL